MLRFQIVARGPWMVHGKEPCWAARWPDCFDIDFLVYCRLGRGSAEIRDCFVFPHGSLEAGRFTIIHGSEEPAFPSYRQESLRALIGLTDRLDLESLDDSHDDGISCMPYPAETTCHEALAGTTMTTPAARAAQAVGSGRPPLVDRMKSVMKTECRTARICAEEMHRTAVQTGSLRNLVGVLLKDMEFVALLRDTGNTRLPRLLLARVTTRDATVNPADTSPIALAAVKPATPGKRVNGGDQRQRSVRTMKALAQMSESRRDTVMQILETANCFSGDLANALLAATPRAKLAGRVAPGLHHPAFIRSFARMERRLVLAQERIRMCAPGHGQRLVEIATGSAWLRQLLVNPSVCRWLEVSRPGQVQLLRELATSKAERRQPRRSMKVAS